MRVRTTSPAAPPSSSSAAIAISKQRPACVYGWGSQEPSGHTGAVPETSTRSPPRIAREKPIGASNGEPDDARRRSAMRRGAAAAGRIPPVLPRQLGLDVRVLGLLEGLEPLLPGLAAQARLLEAAE